jgi:hypothetical protein
VGNILAMLLGLAMMIGGAVLGVAWIAFCFGTVVVGIMLLIFAPQVLLAPFLITAGGVSVFGSAYKEFIS